MKKYISFLYITSLLLTSCTKEVFIDTGKDQDKLVIEAIIDIDKNNSTGVSTQSIKLSKTSSFNTPNFITVKGATITVTNENNEIVGTFLDINSTVDTEEDGIYTAVDFKTPKIGETYFLNVNVNNQIYIAQDTYTSIVDLEDERISQETVTFPEEIIQININIDNEIGVDNFYLFKIDTPFYEIPQYGNGDDEFLSEEPGENNYDFVYFDEELEANQKIDITISGISKGYNSYLTELLGQAQESGGPFTTAPATVRGNIINQTNTEAFPLGYFALNQFVKTTYTVLEKE